jgi:hypothetical protein
VVVKKHLLVLFLFLFFLMPASNANAYMDMDLFLKLKDTKNLELYFQGWLDAAVWANAHLKGGRKEKPLFCPPGKLNLEPTNLIFIVDDYYRKNQKFYLDFAKNAAAAGKNIEEEKIPFGMVALDALQEAFPCK